VVGPEAPLVLGLVDRLEAVGIKAFGPSAKAAALEGSKGFMKDIAAKYGIPSAAYGRFSDPAKAKAFVRARAAPIVVKADGLAAGKGVTVARSLPEAEAAIDAALVAGQFGRAGRELVVEEFLEGEEASVLALVDGTHFLTLPSAQDHKAAYDGDRGPNTGGMGAYSPAPVMTDAMVRQTMDEIIKPTVAAMAARCTLFTGVLFAGLMITTAGPKLIEYNVRFGDPETQVLVMRLKSDLLAALIATADGVLDNFDLRWREESALTVVMAANGYPGPPQLGSEIKGLDAAAAVEGVEIFHAGTRREGNRYFASGGRVLSVTALGRTIGEAQARAYAAIAEIDWPGGFCRKDIGWRAIAREKSRA
jgi:phosphoribosylamine---glycine ligase